MGMGVRDLLHNLPLSIMNYRKDNITASRRATKSTLLTIDKLKN